MGTPKSEKAAEHVRSSRRARQRREDFPWVPQAGIQSGSVKLHPETRAPSTYRVDGGDKRGSGGVLRGGTPPTMKPQGTSGRAASCHPERSEGSPSITAARRVMPPCEPRSGAAPPTSPERDDPAEPDHKGENSRLSYQLSVMSAPRVFPRPINLQS